MTGKKIYIGLVAAVIIIIVTLLILFENSDSGSNSINMDLYFFNESETSIVAENRDIKYNSITDLPDMVLKKLYDGPSDNKNHPIFNKDVRLLSMNESDNDITLNYSKEYLCEDSSKTFLTTYAIVKSLCQVNGIKRVMVTVEGEEIVASDGTIIGFLSDDDIDLVTDTKTKDSKTFTLYFADNNLKKLVSERRTIKITDTIPVEQYIVNELIKGTQADNAKSIISPDTELISAQTTDNTCFVNFKSSFIDKNAGNEKNEKLVIYSIVDSLCELENVSFVQFLVDGKKVDRFGSIDVSDLFNPDRKMIK